MSLVPTLEKHEAACLPPHVQYDSYLLRLGKIISIKTVTHWSRFTRTGLSSLHSRPKSLLSKIFSYLVYLSTSGGKSNNRHMFFLWAI